MKTFQQFMKETPKSDNVPSIIKSLKGLATDIGTNNPDLPKQIKGAVFNQIKKKAEPMVKKGMGMMDKNINLMQKELPTAMGKFDSFLKSGEIQKGLGKFQSQIKKLNK
tara:strand:+ start:415 stop:741 length:327 start_codon:yes stop_codon:yes gene_type:complete